MIRAAAALALIGACGRTSSSPPSPIGSRDGGALVANAALSALPRTERGDVAMATLAGDAITYAIQSRTRRESQAELLAMFAEHAQVTGRLDDYAAIDAISARWIDREGARPEAHLARAKQLATLHRFGDAAAELDRAATLGASDDAIAHARVDLDEATGHRDVLAERAHDAQVAPNLVSITMYALSLAEHGDPKAGLALMPKALATWRDISAVPFAWFLFQWGRLAEDSDDLVTARALYEEASRRLPRYGEAGRHLAALAIRAGDDRAARAILESLDRLDPHPETTAMLAELAHRAHDPRAPALRDAARAGWERYLAAYPAAFSDHAARFYLGVGGDPARALALAETNLANRTTAAAYALVVDAALAASQPARACDAAASLVALPSPRRARFSAWKAFSACGRAADADRLARELGITGPVSRGG